MSVAQREHSRLSFCSARYSVGCLHYYAVHWGLALEFELGDEKAL